MLNPVIKDLKKNKLISSKNIHVISKNVRNNKNVKVLYDKQSKIIFLEKFVTGKHYFGKQRIYENNKKFNLVINGKKRSLTRLDDDLRRVKQFKKFTKNKILCDYGCGDGNFINRIKNAKNRFALDINIYNSKFFKKKGVKFIKSLSEIDTNLNIIFMFHSLHYMPYQIDILKKIRNKMSNNGMIIIEVPHANDFLLQSKMTTQFKDFSFHVENLVWHTKKSLEKFLKVAGFKKIKVSFFQRYDLNNHLNWILNKNDKLKQVKYIKDNQKIFQYKKKLINLGLTDTLIATAKK